MINNKKILIIDDEKSASNSLCMIIEKFCAGFEIVGVANNADEGITLIEIKKPDIVFLDIEMPRKNGFEMLQSFNKISFQIIFVTAYNQYAIKAFRFNALDYLLKPVDIDLVKSALSKASERINNNILNVNSEILKYLNERLENIENAKFAIQSNNKTEYVNISEIIRIEANGNYSMFFLSNKTKRLASKTLKEYEDLLPKNIFFRVHHSHIVNTKHIRRYIRKAGNSVIMLDKSQVPIAIRRRKDFEIFMDNIII